MRITTAVLIAHDLPGWPIPVIAHRVPLGKRYRVDLDSIGVATLENPEHPEFGTLRLDAIRDIDDGFPLPLACLRLEAPEAGGS